MVSSPSLAIPLPCDLELATHRSGLFPQLQRVLLLQVRNSVTKRVSDLQIQHTWEKRQLFMGEGSFLGKFRWMQKATKHSVFLIAPHGRDLEVVILEQLGIERETNKRFLIPSFLFAFCFFIN